PQNFLSNNSFVSLSKVGAEDRDARRGTTKARMSSAKASSSATTASRASFFSRTSLNTAFQIARAKLRTATKAARWRVVTRFRDGAAPASRQWALEGERARREMPSGRYRAASRPASRLVQPLPRRPLHRPPRRRLPRGAADDGVCDAHLLFGPLGGQRTRRRIHKKRTRIHQKRTPTSVESGFTVHP